MPRPLPTLAARAASLASPERQREVLRRLPLAREFDVPLRRGPVEILQINVGKICNQTCRHCHVDAGPDRRESMSDATLEACVRVLERSSIGTVDITGGAPEMFPRFRWLVERCRALGRHVIDRSNLTILETPSHRDLPEFLAEHAVEVVSSLPHWTASGTDRQRGDGVFEPSVRALRRLNALGYGTGRVDRRLTLVVNPLGAFLPTSQAELEATWRRELTRRHGVTFDRLIAITNMPISRYLEWLEASRNLEPYMHMLVDAFNAATLPGLMCRSTISVAWDGSVHDCDFNQMLALEMPGGMRIEDFDPAVVEGRPIATDRHCFGCTAGAGSSCGGATA